MSDQITELALLVAAYRSAAEAETAVSAAVVRKLERKVKGWKTDLGEDDLRAWRQAGEKHEAARRRLVAMSRQFVRERPRRERTNLDLSDFGGR